MVFLRKIKYIEQQPCLITKMDVDLERKRICFIDISNAVFIFNIQSLHNLVDQWRFQFQKQFNYSSIQSLDNPIYKFNSYELHKPTQIKFSNSKCKLIPKPSQVPLIQQSPINQVKRLNTNQNDLQKSNIDRNKMQNNDNSEDEEDDMIGFGSNVKGKIMRSYTTFSEKSNKKIKINMIYSNDQSGIYQEQQGSSYQNKMEQELRYPFDEMYAVAILENQGNIKVFSPVVDINEWIKVGNIVYCENQYSTLDFTWSKQSKYLLAVYSDSYLIQYDASQQFVSVKKFNVDFSFNCKIITNNVNDCLILKNQKNLCQLIDFDSKKAYTFDVFKKNHPAENELSKANNIKKSYYIKKKDRDDKSQPRVSSQYQKKHKSNIINIDDIEKEKLKMNKQPPDQRDKSNKCVFSNKNMNGNQKDINKPNAYFTYLLNQQEQGRQNRQDDYGDEERSDGQMSEQDCSDESLVDQDLKENITVYIQQSQIDVSQDAKYICLGTVEDKGVLLYSVNQHLDNDDHFNFQWKNGFKKACFEEDKISIEGSSFSDYMYIKDSVQVNFPINPNQINNLVYQLDSIIQSQPDEMVQQRVLAIGSSNSLILYSIIDIENKPFFKKLVQVQDLKCDIIHIIWMNAYSLLLLLSDYSLIYFKTSPADIGFSIKTI